VAYEFYRWTWTKVLKRAEKDLTSKNSTIRNSALRWFLSDIFDINSFYGICFILNYDPDEFRIKLLKKYNIKKSVLKSRTVDIEKISRELLQLFTKRESSTPQKLSISKKKFRKKHRRKKKKPLVSSYPTKSS
jgi:hypothetical protein